MDVLYACAQQGKDKRDVRACAMHAAKCLAASSELTRMPESENIDSFAI